MAFDHFRYQQIGECDSDRIVSRLPVWIGLNHPVECSRCLLDKQCESKCASRNLEVEQSASMPPTKTGVYTRTCWLSARFDCLSFSAESSGSASHRVLWRARSTNFLLPVRLVSTVSGFSPQTIVFIFCCWKRLHGDNGGINLPVWLFACA